MKRLKPFFEAVPMWYALALDDSGHLIAGLMDGRAVVFDVNPREDGSGVGPHVVRTMDLATPVEVTGVPIYAGVGWAAGLAISPGVSMLSTREPVGRHRCMGLWDCRRSSTG